MFLPDGGCSHQPPVQITSSRPSPFKSPTPRPCENRNVPGMTFPGLLGSLIACISQGSCGVAPRRESGHLALVVLALGLPAHDQHAVAVAEEVRIEGRLVAGAVPDFVLRPVAGLCPWGSRTSTRASRGSRRRSRRASRRR